MLKSIEDDIPTELDREILVTKKIGVGPFNRKSKIMILNPNFTSSRIYRDMTEDGFTHWMYVPRVEE